METSRNINITSYYKITLHKQGLTNIYYSNKL